MQGNGCAPPPAKTGKKVGKDKKAVKFDVVLDESGELVRLLKRRPFWEPLHGAPGYHDEPGGSDEDVDPEAAAAAAEAEAKEKELAALEAEYEKAEAQFRIDLGLDTGEGEEEV